MIINSREMTLSLRKQKMETENVEYKGYVFESFQETKNNTAVDKTIRLFDFNDSGDTFCQTTVLVYTVGTNKALQLNNSYQTTLKLGPVALEELH